MARLSIWHDRNFDRSADYIIAKPFRLSGRLQTVGELFDKSQVTTRLLRQLYEQRKLKFLNGGRSPAPPGKSLRRIREDAEEDNLTHGHNSNS